MNTAFKGFFLPMRTSLQARMVSVVVIAFFAIAVLLSVGSMLLVRSSVLDQVSQESQRDFSNQLVEAKKVINSADSTDFVQYQQLANDVASMLQQDAPPSLVGVYLWSRNAAGREIIPVSTEPSHVSLISEDMHARVNADTDGTIYYQPVTITHDTVQQKRSSTVDGLYVSRHCVLLIAMSPTHVLGWRLVRSEHAGAWQALLARIAPPDVVVTDGGAGFAKVCHAQWSDTRIQRCLFRISANVRSRTTRNPMIQGWSRTLRFITTTYPYYQ